MNIQGIQATYRRLYHESSVWKLLRAENAPHILAFIADLFVEETEVPYGRARGLLDEFIKNSREQGLWPTENNAAYYLNGWIKAGWLREMDDMLSKTDASETVLRFCRNLDEPYTSTTASHLRIVQDAVRDFVVAISDNIDDRVSLLEQNKAQIQQEIDDLHAGVFKKLNETQQRERIREIYQLASILTGDFRRFEDEIRQLDKELRIDMIEGNSSRGDILFSLMQKEQFLAKSDAGSAFDGFCQLLQDQDRSTEFREQLRSILNHPVAQQLSEQQKKYLGQLMRELARESGRVFQVRRRTEEGLRAYIASGAALESRMINRLMSQLEKQAIGLLEQQCDLKTEMQLDLAVGSVQISSPENFTLKSPSEHMDTRGVQQQQNRKEPSVQMLQYLDSVQVRVVAEKAHNTLLKKGVMSIAHLTKEHPLQAGLEELVAYLRIAKAIKAPQLVEQNEQIQFHDQNGICLQASIPTYYLSAELFPDNLDELAL
ncbi:DUF3375 domain-containing protein [uncultured Acinetobacter sp.]|uniref:DUF3375 domain-containing protein n=1 Tax=uncultured Acinetobacter sp. TaxID=165433 RepID=UPI00258472A6|nr:DUF3375 domain-containing protein [uncultured Acinetobacter sp.]